MTTASGGPSTINGVLYQMLWTLLNTVEIQVNSDADPDKLMATQAFLVVEPAGGGGDVVRFGSSGRRVQQVKARTNGGTWSLAEIVKDVLPDLYKAVDIDRADDSYEFITEGKIGDWKEVDLFLKEIRLEQTIVLDDVRPLPLGHSAQGTTPFFDKPTYTQRTLFDKIVSHLKTNDETQAQAEAKVWHLLSHFTCIWDKTPMMWEEKIDRFLLEVIDYAENVQQKRMLLISVLAKKATAADTTIRAVDLFNECGLNGQRLSNWQLYLTRAAQLLNRTEHLRGYIAESDVRPIMTSLPQSSMVVFSGESGQGKSWQLFSAARYLSLANVIALFSATGNATEDKRVAAEMFWEKIGNNDHPLSLSRISERLRMLNAVPPGQWLYLCVDNLQVVEEAKALAIEDWEELKIRLIVTASPLVAQEMKIQSPQRVEVVDVDNFTEQEMRKYLVETNWERWRAIPPDVRDTLRRPLLARLYREIVSDTVWTSISEYKLYDRWWSDLRKGRELTSDRLVRLAYSKLRGQAYPWTAHQLSAVGLDQSSAEDLIQYGGLQRTTTGDFIVWHDRLLNWLVAEALLDEHLSGNLSEDALCTDIGALFLEQQIGNNYLGYVPMDVVWMLITRYQEKSTLVDAVLDALASRKSHWQSSEILFKGLLPTVGPTVASAITRYLIRHGGGEDYSETNALITGLASFDAEDIMSETTTLLHHADLYPIRAAIQLISRKPHPNHLAKLWRLYCDIHLHPERFIEDGNERDQTWRLEYSCYNALKECVALNPEWLETAIFHADATQEPVHDLAYLLAGLYGERERWLRCKPMLRVKIDLTKERAIASNIFTHNDETEKDWLRLRIRVQEDSLGTSALRALTRLDSDAAAEAVTDLDGQDLYLTRNWCLRSLLLRRPEVVYANLWDRLVTDPHNIMRSFDGQEDHLTIEMLDWLLDRAEQLLTSSNDLEDAYLPLSLLAKTNRLALFQRFGRRRGTALEVRLADLLSQSPRPYVYQETSVREPALAVLYRIGGDGLTQVVNEWLAAPSAFSRYDAFKIAFKQFDNETKWLLDSLAVFNTRPIGSSEVGDHSDYFAIETLAKMQEWSPVIRFITQNGMNRIPKYVTDASFGRICLLDTTLASAIAAFEEHDGSHAGAILALGVGGRSDYLDRIVSVLTLAPIGTEIARAATLALSLLDDPDGHATDVLIQRLSIGEGQLSVIVALMHNPSIKALNALASHLQNHFDTALAMDLLRFPETRETALTEMRSAIQRSTTEANSVFSFLERDNDTAAALELLNTSELRHVVLETAFAQEGMFWHTGSKAAHIFALSCFDPDTAFDAALLALQDPTSHDREYYPHRLIAINKQQAIPALFEMASKEGSYVLTASVGRALAEVAEEAQPSIIQEIQNISEQRRAVACQLAAYQPFSQELQDSVRASLEDERVEVLQAAEEALWQIQNNIWCDELMVAFAAETSLPRKWKLLDSALNLGDPGDLHHYWPNWLVKYTVALPYAWQEYIGEKLKKRREEVTKEAIDADKRQND